MKRPETPSALPFELQRGSRWPVSGSAGPWRRSCSGGSRAR